jgi:GT2 family glycosyltransferase
MKWQRLIKKSGLFDSKFYLFLYSDVRATGIDPIEHYVKYGASEGRNPSGEFDTSFYLKQYEDVQNSDVNPLVQYILQGRDEGRFKNNDELSLRIISDSKLFDEEYYLLTYPDVKEAAIDPIEHYVKYGASEGRNPSAKFDASFYYGKHKGLRESGANPLVHYVLYGKEKGLGIVDDHKAIKAISGVCMANASLKNIVLDKIFYFRKKVFELSKIIISILKTIKNNPSVRKEIYCDIKSGELKLLLNQAKNKSRNILASLVDLVDVIPACYFTTFDKKKYTLNNVRVDIIIPVYNGYEFLEKLFDSIERNTASDYRLIVTNDCSSDERVKTYLLKRLENHPDAIFIDNDENQGFLNSVNKAYSHVSDHFLLLNTDTEVPDFWLERLMYPIIHMDKVASTTPFTNSGEIASFPNFVTDNEIFDGMTVDDLDEVFKGINAQEFYTEIPTGVGFCMGVNYTLTKEIGMFVSDTFGKGYGEENDWCQRAIQKGFRNILVPNLFVYHKHGGSFTVEKKQELLKVNYKKLLDRHPNYEDDVREYIHRDPHATLRHIIVLLASSKSTAMHLIFDHDLGGGTNIYTDELIDAYTNEEKNVLCIKYNYHSNYFKIFHHYKCYEFSFKISSYSELQLLLSKIDVKELFLNSLVSFKNSKDILAYIHGFVEEKKAELILPIHDFYALCPSYTLINNEGKYCNVPLLETCELCMKNNMQEWRQFHGDEVDVSKWRELWFKLLTQSHTILCFSHSSKELLLKAYPELAENKIAVIPHKVNFLEQVVLEDNTTDIITIGVLGAINYAKGSQVIKHLVQTIDRDKHNIRIVVIGEIAEPIQSKKFSITGRYNRSDIANIIENKKIDIFLIPSIWPETFSYTTQEIMMMEMPLMVFNLGAPAERIVHYYKGYIIDDVSVNAILKTIEKFQLKIAG